MKLMTNKESNNQPHFLLIFDVEFEDLQIIWLLTEI